MNKAVWKDTEFKIGEIIRVDYKIKEKKRERSQPFQGRVISIKGKGDNKTFTVRKIGADGVGVERIFPLNSPWITNLKVVGKPKKRIKRAKLYWLRQRQGKKARL